MFSLHPPFVHFGATSLILTVSGRGSRTVVEIGSSSAPGGLSLVRAMLSRTVITYSTPSAPAAGTSQFHRMALCGSAEATRRWFRSFPFGRLFRTALNKINNLIRTVDQEVGGSSPPSCTKHLTSSCSKLLQTALQIHFSRSVRSACPEPIRNQYADAVFTGLRLVPDPRLTLGDAVLPHFV